MCGAVNLYFCAAVVGTVPICRMDKEKREINLSIIKRNFCGCDIYFDAGKNFAYIPAEGYIASIHVIYGKIHPKQGGSYAEINIKTGTVH